MKKIFALLAVTLSPSLLSGCAAALIAADLAVLSSNGSGEDQTTITGTRTLEQVKAACRNLGFGDITPDRKAGTVTCMNMGWGGIGGVSMATVEYGGPNTIVTVQITGGWGNSDQAAHKMLDSFRKELGAPISQSTNQSGSVASSKPATSQPRKQPLSFK